MPDSSLTAQVQAILRHDGPLEIFVIGLAAWHAQATATEFHFLHNNLRELAQRVHCSSFKLPSQDLVIVCEANAGPVLAGIEALEKAFIEAHPVVEGFSLLIEDFSLPERWEDLRQRLRDAAVAQLHDTSRAQPKQPGSRATQRALLGRSHAGTLARAGLTRDNNKPARANAPLTGPLTAQSLAVISELVDAVNFSNFIGRQQIYRLGKPWQPLYCEHFSNLELLQSKLFPNVNIVAEEPLFFELCRHLDRMMLITTLIERPARQQMIGLNLTGGIANTREFQQFDRGLSAAERSRIVVEIHWLDALRDLNNGNGFLAQLALRGFQIALDRVGLDVLPLIAAADLPHDYIKIVFDRDKLACLTERKNIKGLQQLDPQKLILIGCDHDIAFEFGQSLGIIHYQGWTVTEQAKNNGGEITKQKAAWRKALPKGGGSGKRIKKKPAMQAD